jgi:imidazolonepropionase-like amidohydrolase
LSREKDERKRKLTKWKEETMKKRIALLAAAIFLVTLPLGSFAQDIPQRHILFTNVNIFDGVNDELRENMNVLVEGNLIKTISSEPIVDNRIQTLEVKENPDLTIDGGGRTLMPGLIDMHAHLAIHAGMLDGRDGYDQMAIGGITQESMRSYLNQGFTTVRDAGGNVLGVAKSVKNGRVPGPRIYPSGGFLSQTGGHGDTGRFNDQPGDRDYLWDHGFAHIVDGRAEVMKAARYNLRSGATQIKIMAGGGVASEFDPLHMTQFTLDEMKAAVEIAADYGTYVHAHAYHDQSVNRAIDAGVRCIEHNFLVSEPTIKRMKKEGVALSIQSVMSLEAFGDPDSITFFNADQKAKAKRVNSGAGQMMKWALKHDLIMVTGGDMFGEAYVHRQADNLVWLQTVGFSDYQILKTATSAAAEVLSWSGEMNPYKDGGLGTIEPGNYADLVLIEGNPLEDITLLKDYENNMKVIMKDGKIWKNTL